MSDTEPDAAERAALGAALRKCPTGRSSRIPSPKPGWLAKPRTEWALVLRRHEPTPGHDPAHRELADSGKWTCGSANRLT